MDPWQTLFWLCFISLAILLPLRLHVTFETPGPDPKAEIDHVRLQVFELLRIRAMDRNTAALLFDLADEAEARLCP